MWQSFLNLLSGSSNSNTTTTTDSNASPVFSYVLLGAAVLLLVAVIFGELEEVTI